MLCPELHRPKHPVFGNSSIFDHTDVYVMVTINVWAIDMCLRHNRIVLISAQKDMAVKTTGAIRAVQETLHVLSRQSVLMVRCKQMSLQYTLTKLY